jgi:hypothetical protein
MLADHASILRRIIYMGKISPFIAAVVITLVAMLTLAAQAQAFPGHGGGHHHGSPALSACMAAAPASVKANLWSMFKSSSLKTDHQAVETAKQNLAQQILAKNTSLTQYETALSQAQLKMIQDEDAIAQGVCGQLSSAQLAAASTLYTNLQNSRQAMHGYFEAAHQAAGQASEGAGQATSE